MRDDDEMNDPEDDGAVLIAGVLYDAETLEELEQTEQDDAEQR